MSRAHALQYVHMWFHHSKNKQMLKAEECRMI